MLKRRMDKSEKEEKKTNKRSTSDLVSIENFGFEMTKAGVVVCFFFFFLCFGLIILFQTIYEIQMMVFFGKPLTKWVFLKHFQDRKRKPFNTIASTLLFEFFEFITKTEVICFFNSEINYLTLKWYRMKWSFCWDFSFSFELPFPVNQFLNWTSNWTTNLLIDFWDLLTIYNDTYRMNKWSRKMK